MLNRVLKAFTVFCEDMDIIDNVIFFDDSSTDLHKFEMERILHDLFPNQNSLLLPISTASKRRFQPNHLHRHGY